MTFLEIGLIVLLVILVLTFLVYVRHLKRVHGNEILDMDGRMRSRSTLYGKLTEQFAPFMEKYPHNPQDFRFIGSPIDGIQFVKDKVIFVEIKAGPNAGLNSRQQQVKRLIQDKKVEWLEFAVR